MLLIQYIYYLRILPTKIYKDYVALPRISSDKHNTKNGDRRRIHEIDI